MMPIQADEIVRTQLASQFSLRADTLKRVAKLSATLGVSFYYHTTTKLNPSAKPLPPKGRGNESKRQDPGQQP
jgi:hypothetical protein